MYIPKKLCTTFTWNRDRIEHLNIWIPCDIGYGIEHRGQITLNFYFTRTVLIMPCRTYIYIPNTYIQPCLIASGADPFWCYKYTLNLQQSIITEMLADFSVFPGAKFQVIAPSVVNM